MSKHTETPWEACDSELWGDRTAPVLIYSTARDEDTLDEICEVCCQPDPGVRDANIRLIAAAPDLLDACKRLMVLIRAGGSVANIAAGVSFAQDAIRKAEGAP